MSKAAGNNKRKVAANAKESTTKKQKTTEGSTSVYFGNLTDIKTDDLKNFLTKNNVNLKFPNIKRKQHYAHILLASEEDVKKALNLDGSKIGKIEIKVTPSARKEKKAVLPNSNLYVVNVDDDEAAVKKHFSKYGKVVGVKLVGTKNAIVSFDSIDAAQKAIAAAATDQYKSKKLYIRYAKNNKSRGFNNSNNFATAEDDSDDDEESSEEEEEAPVTPAKGKNTPAKSPAKGKTTPAKSPAKGKNTPAKNGKSPAKRTTPNKNNTPNKKAKTSK
jgi:hypothetical protein